MTQHFEILLLEIYVVSIIMAFLFFFVFQKRGYIENASKSAMAEIALYSFIPVFNSLIAVAFILLLIDNVVNFFKRK